MSRAADASIHLSLVLPFLGSSQLIQLHIITSRILHALTCQSLKRRELWLPGMHPPDSRQLIRLHISSHLTKCYMPSPANHSNAASYGCQAYTLLANSQHELPHESQLTAQKIAFSNHAAQFDISNYPASMNDHHLMHTSLLTSRWSFPLYVADFSLTQT